MEFTRELYNIFTQISKINRIHKIHKIYNSKIIIKIKKNDTSQHHETFYLLKL